MLGARSATSASIEESVRQDEQRLLGIFEHLHENPELAFMEFETSALVAEEFEEHGFVVHTHIAKTGVVGVMENGPGPVVIFRSDMDALPLKEETTLSYKSTAVKRDASGQELPVMHACGHDAHTTWLIGMSKPLSAGYIAVKDGRRMAGSDQIDVLIPGIGGHGSTPHAAKDPVVMGALAVLAY